MSITQALRAIRLALVKQPINETYWQRTNRLHREHRKAEGAYRYVCHQCGGSIRDHYSI